MHPPIEEHLPSSDTTCQSPTLNEYQVGEATQMLPSGHALLDVRCEFGYQLLPTMNTSGSVRALHGGTLAI
jgi:hypothetical protein